MANYPIAGKSVLITGAARGIGAESARRLSKRGANVALVGLESEELQRVAGDCGANAVASRQTFATLTHSTPPCGNH